MNNFNSLFKTCRTSLRSVRPTSILKGVLLFTSLFLLLATAGCAANDLGMLNPKGILAFQQRKLLFDTLALMLIVVLPVIVMSITFVYHYQVSHRIRDYKPNWSHSYFLESFWWGIPCVIIVILAIITWKKTYEMDPYSRIPGHDKPPLLVQAIALPYKWLFIYPEQNIATINYLVMPAGRQVEYWFTNDNVPMSAFFVPQVGSQIYTMAGMRTRLHLLANVPGTYNGLNTQYNGFGFSDMRFTVQVMQPDLAQQWFDTIKKTGKPLTKETYLGLIKPSIEKPQFFAGVEPHLFHSVMELYMTSVGATHPRANQVENTQFDKIERNG